MSFRFPASVFDEPEKLLDVLGSFWSTSYRGSFPVESLLHARAQLDAQNHLDLLHLIACMSRYTVPVFRTDNWFLLRLPESGRNATAANLAAFDGAHAFDGEVAWGLPVGTPKYLWALPEGLTRARLALNRITEASLTLTEGVDFIIDAERGVIAFRADPFASELVSIRDVVEDNEVVDREAALWLYRGEFDYATVYGQFGYALGVRLRSSEGYRELVNAVFDALVDGGTQHSTDQAFAAMAGVPLVGTSGEVVEDIFLDARNLWVITDKGAYRYHRRANPVVGVGDVLTGGQSLTDTLEFMEFGSGQLSTGLRALAVPQGHLAAGYHADVVFENKVVPLVVEEGVTGYTRVSFEVGGYPGDVERFWDEAHERGVAAGQTLAMLLDRRPEGARDTQPTAAALPAEVNPLEFLAQNVFRNNLYVVVARPATFGTTALGLHNAPILRKAIPPHTAVLVLVELAVADDPVILDAPGDDARPGCQERLSGYSAAGHVEAMDPGALVVERVRGRRLGGFCQ